MSGMSPKTNIGTTIVSGDRHRKAGLPVVSHEKRAAGTITDIRFPGEEPVRFGAGILIKVQFDQPEFHTNKWLVLKEDYHAILGLLGNRDAILSNPPRIMFHYHPARFTRGYAELICDNRQEYRYGSFTHNPSALFVNCISGLATGASPIG